MQADPYRLDMPDAWSSGVVFASPHSGAIYTDAFLTQSILCRSLIRSSEDAFVDQLFGAAPSLGAPLLAANAPRAYVDLNRSVDELDPALIEGVRRTGSNPRISSGLGVIPRVVANGRGIYSGKLPMSEAVLRLDTIWHPYHDCLAGLLDQARALFSEAILIDCHSMPHEAIDAVSRRGGRPEIVLGDRFGASASGELVEVIEASFAAAGLKVARNAPFAGAYTAQAYGRPTRGQHVVQIEIDRALYMDEVRIEPNGGFADMVQVVTGVIADILSYSRGAMRMAAE